MTTILPANASLLERAIDAAAESLIERISPPIPALMSPSGTPAEFLPYLAADRGVSEWANAASEAAQREMVANAWATSRLAGTRYAIKRALLSAGYPVIRVQSATEHREKWRAAGGEILDGAGDLSVGDLSAPPGSFRLAVSHWAEYAVILNTADLLLTAEMLRRVIALCDAHGPLRSRLATIILLASAQFEATPLLAAVRARARMALKNCRRISVPSFDILDGCDFLDGAGTIDGGQLAIKSRARIALCGTALGGMRQEPPELLIDYLDGIHAIAGELIDGDGLIDGGILHYPSLGDSDDALDGTSNLGAVAGPDHIWFSGLVRLRRGSNVTQEPL